MKDVKLKTLTLENFKGFSTTLDFKDKTMIRGTNKARKSTVFNAFLWLLLGTDSKDRTNFDLYDSTVDFTHENAIPAVVEGKFTIDGVERELKRTARQKWTRPRGKEEYVKDKSDEYLYYIDGLAVSAKAYKDFIEQNFAPIDKLKLMLNVRYYEMLDWKVLRKHFADLVGEIDPKELKGDYKVIEDMLAKYGSVENVKEKLKQDINPLKRDLNNIEAEIKGMQNMLPDTDGVGEAEKEISGIFQRIEELDSEIVGLGDANKPYIEKRNAELKAIAEKKAELDRERSVWEGERKKVENYYRSKFEDIDNANQLVGFANGKVQQEEASTKRQIEATEQQVDFLSDELERLRKENAEIKARTFNEDLKCPTCGQHMPPEEVESARQKFYDKREQDHKACVERGLKTKESLARQEELLAELKSKTFEQKPYVSAETLQKEYEEAMMKFSPFETSDIYGILTDQIEKLQTNLTVVPEVNSEDLQKEKAELNKRMSELQAIISRKSERAKGEEKIAMRESERDKIGAELARLEGLLFKCVEREREWASIVRDRANKNLKYAHVEMTEITKAGEVVDICTLSVNKVSSAGTNREAKMNIGADVSNAFQKHYGLNLPMFIDDAEGIASYNMPDYGNQLVALYADEDYPKLTVL